MDSDSDAAQSEYDTNKELRGLLRDAHDSPTVRRARKRLST